MDKIKRYDMQARIICRSTLTSQLKELDDEMNMLLENGFEPIKMSQATENGISKVCVLMMKTGIS